MSVNVKQAKKTAKRRQARTKRATTEPIDAAALKVEEQKKKRLRAWLFSVFTAVLAAVLTAWLTPVPGFIASKIFGTSGPGESGAETGDVKSSEAASSLAIAPAWPYITGCPGVGQVAMPPGFGSIETFHAVTDVRPTMVSKGAGSWTRGVLYLNLSVAGNQTVEIINVQPHIDRRDLAPPAWIYAPDSGCGPRDSERDFVFNLDRPTFKDAGVTTNEVDENLGAEVPTASLGPDFTLSGKQHSRIRLNVSSCRGNYEWRLDIQYVVSGSREIQHYQVGPFQSYGVANNTTVYRGYQDKTGGVHIDGTSTLTGNDPVMAGSEAAEDTMFAC